MKNILITGCSSGIGLETALYLKNKGYKVFATARDENDVQDLKDMGFDARYLDVREYETISETIKYILQKAGSIDVVFNNAGYGQIGALQDIETKYLKEQFETNVFGMHELTRQIIPVMKKQGHGKIIQHSSVLGLISLKFRGAYNASKYAIEGLSDTLRLELRGSNIDISILNTGPVTSKFRQNAIKNFKQSVNYENSEFKELYEASLKQNKSDVPFNLEAIEVAKVVEKIIKAKKPRPRYYITKATYILAYLKRALSTRHLDFILDKI